MWRYYDLLSFKTSDYIEGLKQQVAEGLNPRDVKVELAKEIICRFHDNESAEDAHIAFIHQFKLGEIPAVIPEVELEAPQTGISIAVLLRDAGLVKSASEGLRLLTQGGVKIGGERVLDKELKIYSGELIVVQVGKRRFAKVKVN